MQENLALKFNVYGAVTEGRTDGLLGEACSKCGGSQAVELDSEVGYYKSCINCGRIEYLNR